MSDLAYEELRAAVKRTPDDYLEAAEDQAFARLGRALASCAEAQKEEEFIEDDDAYMAAATAGSRGSGAVASQRLAATRAASTRGPFSRSPRRASRTTPSRGSRRSSAGSKAWSPVDGADLWEDAFARPRLRLLASIARARARDGPLSARPCDLRERGGA